MGEVVLDGLSLRLEDVERVALDPSIRVRLSDEAAERMLASQKFIEELVDAGGPVYGVTTGFGRLADIAVAPDEREALQRNLVRSHASGVGSPMDRASVRTLMLLRANALARGNSGCRVLVVEQLLELLNAGIHPRVPEFGSVGASGDLGPLAHVALGLLGEGLAEYSGDEQSVETVMMAEGIAPLTLGPKGVLALSAAERAVEVAEIAGAMSLEALLGTPEPFRKEIHEARPHKGQGVSASKLRTLLADSEIRASHQEDDPRVQDAYSLRCMPQVHGAAREAFGYVRGVLEVEANSATDNPLVFPSAEVVVSGGNFHAQIVAQALDLLTIAVTDLAAISERRIERMLNPDLSIGLPAFLSKRAGVESGFMVAQVTAVDLLSELRVLAHPASVDSVTTSANQEDHVSMGLGAARKAKRAVGLLEQVLATELMCAAQGIDFRRPLTGGRGVEIAHQRIRAVVSELEHDRSLGPDLDALTDLVRYGDLSRIAAELDR